MYSMTEFGHYVLDRAIDLIHNPYLIEEEEKLEEVNERVTLLFDRVKINNG